MAIMYDGQVERAANEILKFIKSWQDYELFTGVICDALQDVETKLLAEKRERQERNRAASTVVMVGERLRNPITGSQTSPVR
jgi:hypothetical protein